jgi:pyochelin synthetase
MFERSDRAARGIGGRADRCGFAATDLGLIRSNVAMANVQRLEVPLPPRTVLELQLVRIWEDLLDRRPIGIDEHFFEAGGDSISAMSLLARVARETEYTLPAGGVIQAPTIAKLAVFLQEQAVADRWDPLVPIQPAGTRPPFFCVHPGGGNVLCYLQLAQMLNPDQPLFALQAPGVDGIREPLSSVEEMAREYVGAIARVQARGPYFLGGWSVGGVVAFEIAQQLVEAGDTVATVVIMDSGALYAHALITSIFSDGAVGALAMLRLPFADQVDEFRHRSAAAQLVPPSADDRMAGWIYRVFAANMRALMNYRARPYEGRIDLLQAREPMVPARFEPYREWQRIGAWVELHYVPGNHLTMMRSPHVETTARALEDCLQQAAVARHVRVRPR